MNLIGFGFCYGTLQLMSPTTFWTGSLILGGLFIYDIIMVFYTYVPSYCHYLEDAKSCAGGCWDLGHKE